MAGLSDPLVLESADDSPTFGKDSSFQLDKPVGSASISPCGRDIVLASRQGLHVIDLDSPWSPPRHLSHHTPWEVADVQWSPFAARDYWVVSTSNQKAIVWNLAMTNARASIEHVLHAHTRAITDINFSAHHPDILATCAVDSYVHCWDLRHSARPAMTFCDWFAGATQVKWNRQDSHILASSHDKILRIWDDRKGAHPLRSIEAHATKIYGVDWNRTKTNNVATCSLDKTIKFWDYTGEIDEPTWTIDTPFPVWRARHTPFGSGLLAMPQRGDHDLHLYDRRQGEALNNTEKLRPFHRFDGHDDQVKEFLWRPRGSITDGLDNREFQLVTWGADRVLRLHCVHEEVYQGVGYERGKELKSKFNVTRKNAQYKTFRESNRKSGTKNSKLGLADDFQLEDRLDSKFRGTLGMTLSGAPLNIDSGWGVKTSVGSVTRVGANQRRDIDAISWMRGVKIGKRETTSSDLHRSLSSMLSPSLKTDRIWDTFESLGEEITHVGDKFGKVVFDKIDVPNRFVIVSFSGPWGLENSSIYIKTRISFPKDYPEKATPSFSIEKTASVSIQVLQRISSEAQSVANAYLSRQKNSFEALLRYLLGEQNLEDSLLWLKERPDHTDLDLSQDIASSSSDEDEDVDEFLNSQGQIADINDGMLVVSNSQYNVPVPKICGAIWAGDGRLVCFFPPKEDKSQSLLDLTLKGSERYSRSHKSIFEGFGRFYSRSPIPKKPASTLETIESEDSEYEDISSSSSGSSSSSKIIDALSHHFIPSTGWRGDASETQRAVSIDESQKSSGGTGPPKSIGSKLSNFISIHDFKNHLPSKQELARRFLLDGPDYCAANAEIASSTGDQKLADAWKLVDLILHEEVPLDVAQHPHTDEAILVVKRRGFPKLGRKDNAVNLSSEMAEKLQLSMKGSVKWGSHPFGRWLVQELLRHFEEIADVQMLAMLSCVFSKPRPIKPAPVSIDTSCPHTDIKHQNSQWRLLNHRQTDSSSYFPFDEVARSLLEPEISSVQPRLDLRKGIGIPHSENSSIGAPHSDFMTPFSTGGTPPSSVRPSRISFERNESQVKGISTSPEHHRQAHRSNSNLASAFAASFARPFSFSASASSSPPTTYPRKRPSPVGSYLANTPAGVTWGSTSFFGKPSNVTEDPKSAYSLSLSDTEEDASVARKPNFQVKLKHQDQFHNEGYATVPLLDPSQEKRYRAYRESYAHMLYIWKMPLVRCELLKFNLKSPASSPPLDQSLGPSLLTISKSATNILSNTDHLELDFQIHCTTCFVTLNQHSSPRKCTFCKNSQIPLMCLFCSSLIQGLASPCLSCGHVLHASCRSSLLSLTATTPQFSDHGWCISGCGCNCISHAIVEVEYPSRRKSSASLTVIGDTSGEQEPLEWRDAGQEEEDIWEDVAYESLAKNLGARYLTPRPSQIWRGG